MHHFNFISISLANRSPSCSKHPKKYSRPFLSIKEWKRKSQLQSSAIINVCDDAEWSCSPNRRVFPLLIKQVLFVLTHTQCNTRLIAFVGYSLRYCVYITVLTLSACLPFVVHSVRESIWFTLIWDSVYFLSKAAYMENMSLYFSSVRLGAKHYTSKSLLAV